MTKKEKQFIEAITRSRGMDFVRLGMMVEVCGQPGTVVGFNSGANLDVIFANRLKMGKKKQNCHPQYEIKYFDQAGRVIKDYRKGV